MQKLNPKLKKVHKKHFLQKICHLYEQNQRKWLEPNQRPLTQQT